MIVGIDLGVNLGWCRGNAVGPMEFGTVELDGGTDLGAFLQSAATHLPKIIRGASGIAVEQPFLSESYYPARKLLSLLGMVHFIGRFEGVSSKQIIEVPVATGKLTLSGHGNADKDAMVAAAAARGYEGLDEHQADALGIWWVYTFGKKEAVRPARRRKV